MRLAPQQLSLMLGVTSDNKLTFEFHLHSVVSYISPKIGLFCKCTKIYADDGVVLNSFYSFFASLLAFITGFCICCWFTPKLLDRAFFLVEFMRPNIGINLDQCQKVNCLSVLYRIIKNYNHPFLSKLLPPSPLFQFSRYAHHLNDLELSPIHGNTNQFPRNVVPPVTKFWNGLPNNS